MNLPQTVTDYLEKTMLDWRHDIHRHPELGFEEHRTSRLVIDSLKQSEIEVHSGIGGTGVVGVLTHGSSNRTIGLRADMDALAIDEKNTFDHRSSHDGKMHACGHDGHTAMLLGAARHLSKHRNFDGTIYFIFQPAEEHGRGAQAMLDDGLFERFPADHIFAIHNLPSLPTGHIAVRPGPIMACEDNFEITINGKGTHAAFPHMGIDPIVIGAEIIMALQTLVARSVDPLANAVVSITEINSNGVRNVIPDQVVLKGDTRSYLPEMQDHIEKTMARIVNGICTAHDAKADFQYSREFVSTINSVAETNIVIDVAQELLGSERVIADCPPIMGSEDFGFMLRAKPGCYLFLGNGGDGPGGCSLHNPGYDFNDQILTTGADFWVHLVEHQLSISN